MDLSASPPSLSPPPPAPPSISASKCSTIYPVVHPVPEPAAQAGFSSVPLDTAGHKDKIMIDSSPYSSFADSEKTDQTSSLHVDSSTCNTKTSSALASSCFDESQELFSSLSDTNFENGHSSSSSAPVSLLHKKNYERRQESEKLQKSAQETCDDKNLDENDHMKVTVSLRMSPACLKTFC